MKQEFLINDDLLDNEVAFSIEDVETAPASAGFFFFFYYQNGS
jgi:hypothetical protein